MSSCIWVPQSLNSSLTQETNILEKDCPPTWQQFLDFPCLRGVRGQRLSHWMPQMQQNVRWLGKESNNTVMESARITSMHIVLKQKHMLWPEDMVWRDCNQIPLILLSADLICITKVFAREKWRPWTLKSNVLGINNTGKSFSKTDAYPAVRGDET